MVIVWGLFAISRRKLFCICRGVDYWFGHRNIVDPIFVMLLHMPVVMPSVQQTKIKDALYKVLTSLASNSNNGPIVGYFSDQYCGYIVSV